MSGPRAKSIKAMFAGVFGIVEIKLDLMSCYKNDAHYVVRSKLKLRSDKQITRVFSHLMLQDKTKTAFYFICDSAENGVLALNATVGENTTTIRGTFRRLALCPRKLDCIATQSR